MQWSSKAFRVGPSTIPAAGKGLFALQRIAVGDTIGYYTGEVISAEDLNAGRFAQSEYLLYVTRDHVIVGEGPKANYTRYINHSEQANAFLITSTRWKTARFEAIREVYPGDEVFFDYGECFF